MSSVLYLYLTKTKAKIRNTFSKPSSAIITLLVIAFYGYSIFSVLIPSDNPPIDDISLRIYFLISLGFALMITSITLMNSRTALFFEEDSYYLFIGPFNNQEILSYLNFANAMQCLLLGAMSGFIPLMILQAAGSFNIIIVLFTTLISSLICYILITLLDILYLNDIIDNTKSHKRRWLAIFIIACILFVFIYHFLTSDLDISSAFIHFIQSPMFNFVPLFGWGNFALNSFADGNILYAFLVAIILVVIAILTSISLMRTKGYFYEQAMMDAIEFSEIYKKARAGKNVQDEKKKVHQASVQFKSGEQALFSKSLLILKKTRKLMTFNEIFSLILVVVVFGMILDLGFPFYCIMVIFYITNSINTSPLIEELEHIYVYLIPGTPFKKIINVLLVPFIRTLVYGLLMMIGGIVFMQPDLNLAVFGTLTVLSFVFIIYGGDVLAVRILKSRKSQIVVLMIRTLIMFVACIPGIIIGSVLLVTSHDINHTITFAAPIIITTNILLGLLITYLCRSMFSGNAYLED